MSPLSDLPGTLRALPGTIRMHSEPTNRLNGETGPYLRQHAHNPMDWHPWGEGALERARKEHRPSSCPWGTRPVTGVT